MKFLVNPEIVRRLAALLGLFAAIITYLYHPAYIVQVKLVDPQKIRQGPGQASPREVSGPHWQAAVEGLVSHDQGHTPEQWMNNRSDDVEIGDKELYFAPGRQPFDSVVPQRSGEAYLVFGQGPERLCIAMEKMRPGRAFDARDEIVAPLRLWSWVALLLGLAGYIFLPKARKPDDSLGYNRLWGTVISDVLGLVICGLCFALVIYQAVKEENGLMSLFYFEHGTAGLAVGMFCLSTLGLIIMAVGAWYHNFWVSFYSGGIELHKLFGVTRFAYGDMEQARIDIMPLSKLAMFASTAGAAAGSASSAGHAVMLSGNDHFGLGITLKNGRTKWIRLQSFQYPRKLVRSLKDNGVKLDDDLEKVLEEINAGPGA